VSAVVTTPELDEEQAKLLGRYLLARASEARNDPGAFLEFVMRSEDTNLPVRTAPHQVVFFDFVERHKRGVIKFPRGASKTFCLATYILWCMGHDPMYRAAIISAIQDQAEKVLKLVRETIENNPMVRLVFPNLRRSPNKFDSWSQTKITIARPSATKDATLSAYGVFGNIRGSRLKHVFIDDILSLENVNTDDSRAKVRQWVNADALQTIDPRGDSKAFFIGTPLHPEDLLNTTQKKDHWATLKMDVRGDIEIEDDRDPGVRIDGAPYYDHPLLKPATPPFLRLNCFDDRENLFPARWGSELVDLAAGRPGYIARKRGEMEPWVFQTEYMLLAHDYSTAMCRPEWISNCKRLARIAGVHALQVNAAPNGNLRFMGVDLAIRIGEHHDLTAFFGFEVLPSGKRQILLIEYGRYDLATKLTMVKRFHEAFGFDLIHIEDNAAQYMFVEASTLMDAGLPVKGCTTGRDKAHPEVGLPGLFDEIYRGAWIIPCGMGGDDDVDPRVESACTAAVNYVPDKHTKDVMMAWFLAWQCAKRWGIGTQPASEGGGGLSSFLER
jgi:hypothetical protein